MFKTITGRSKFWSEKCLKAMKKASITWWTSNIDQNYAFGPFNSEPKLHSNMWSEPKPQLRRENDWSHVKFCSNAQFRPRFEVRLWTKTPSNTFLHQKLKTPDDRIVHYVLINYLSCSVSRHHVLVWASLSKYSWHASSCFAPIKISRTISALLCVLKIFCLHEIIPGTKWNASFRWSFGPTQPFYSLICV